MRALEVPRSDEHAGFLLENPARGAASSRVLLASRLAILAMILAGFSFSTPITGLATYYTIASARAEGTSGIRTATGEVYDESAYTCALRHRDFGGLYRVCAAAHPARCVVCRHNDYGPGRRAAARGVVVDLSPASFDALGGRRGITARGVAWGELVVTVESL